MGELVIELIDYISYIAMDRSDVSNWNSANSRRKRTGIGLSVAVWHHFASILLITVRVKNGHKLDICVLAVFVMGMVR